MKAIALIAGVGAIVSKCEMLLRDTMRGRHIENYARFPVLQIAKLSEEGVRLHLGTRQTLADAVPLHKYRTGL